MRVRGPRCRQQQSSILPKPHHLHAIVPLRRCQRDRELRGSLVGDRASRRQSVASDSRGPRRSRIVRTLSSVSDVASERRALHRSFADGGHAARGASLPPQAGRQVMAGLEIGGREGDAHPLGLARAAGDGWMPWRQKGRGTPRWRASRSLVGLWAESLGPLPCRAASRNRSVDGSGPQTPPITLLGRNRKRWQLAEARGLV